MPACRNWRPRLRRPYSRCLRSGPAFFAALCVAGALAGLAGVCATGAAGAVLAARAPGACGFAAGLAASAALAAALCCFAAPDWPCVAAVVGARPEAASAASGAGLSGATPACVSSSVLVATFGAGRLGMSIEISSVTGFGCESSTMGRITTAATTNATAPTSLRRARCFSGNVGSSSIASASTVRSVRRVRRSTRSPRAARVELVFAPRRLGASSFLPNEKIPMNRLVRAWRPFSVAAIYGRPLRLLPYRNCRKPRFYHSLTLVLARLGKRLPVLRNASRCCHCRRSRPARAKPLRVLPPKPHAGSADRSRTSGRFRPSGASITPAMSLSRIAPNTA